jgi:hypothetical protein
MVLEQEPYKLADVSGLVLDWLQDAGGFAAVGLGLGLVALLTEKRWRAVRLPFAVRALLMAAAGQAAVCYLILGTMRFPYFLGSLQDFWDGLPGKPAPPYSSEEVTCLTLGGTGALLAMLLPLTVELRRLRLGRIWALTLLTFREAVRSQILWGYSLLIVVGMFANWFVQSKPEGQLATYVSITYLTMLLLLLLSHIVPASLSIPTDIQKQTIHTILTKPVERFEVVLGRFFGYTLLMTVTLLGMTTLSVLYVYGNGVHPDAEQESLRSRMPIYGQLRFLKNGRESEKGESVGREWEYRQYVAGGREASGDRALWLFHTLPADTGRAVPCEFNFDIFRMTKGEEGKGVFCSLAFSTPSWSEDRRIAYNKDRDAKQSEEYLAETYGHYEVRFKEIVNGHTFAVEVPAGLFENARKTADPSRPEIPLVTVSVKCESPTQFIGVARHDLYLLDGDGWFVFNYYKGAIGIWFRLVLVIGVAVAASTYLSGVISLVCVLFLYGSGLCREFIQSIAEKKNDGGGPTEAVYRLFNNQSAALQLPDAVGQVTGFMDDIFRWILQRFLNLTPDVNRLDYSGYVGAGFNVSAVDLGIGGLLLVGYLLPWLVLSYYLIKSREVAA